MVDHVQTQKQKLLPKKQKERNHGMPRCKFFFHQWKKWAIHNHLVRRIYTGKQRWPQSASSPFSPGKHWRLNGDRICDCN